jgi:hypothetical protein
MSEDFEPIETDEPNALSDSDNLLAYEKDLHVITLVYDVGAESMPSLDLGNCSPWLAITLLQTAIETLQILIPPVDITYKGRVVCQSEFTTLDDEDYDDEDI